MSRRDRQAAKQRIEKKLRHQRELEGRVDVGHTRPHYLRHLGLNDVIRRPPTEQHNTEHPPVIRGDWGRR